MSVITTPSSVRLMLYNYYRAYCTVHGRFSQN